MKLILFSLLMIFIVACDQGPVEADFVPMTQEEIFRQEKRLKEKRMKKSLERKNQTKNAITKQSTKREYLKDVKDLEQTNEKKIAFFLSKARTASDFMDMPTAKRYAQKVLELDPKNREARSILGKSNSVVKMFNLDGSKNAKIRKETKERLNLVKAAKKGQNNALYKGSAERGVKSFLGKQTHTLEMKDGKIRAKKR